MNEESGNRFRFRVWDEEEKKWSDGLLNDGQGWLGVEWFWDGGGIDSRGNAIDESRFTIEQCTGLRDADGLLIYEGDIVLQKYKEDYIQLVVEWISERALFELVSLHKITRTKIYWRITQAWISEFEVRVVGNIHEHPELLSFSTERNSALRPTSPRN